MKASIVLTAVLALAAKASAECWSEKLGYPCCSSNNTPVYYTDEDGDWGIENKDWCGIPKTYNCWSEPLGYPCCSKNTKAVYNDADGKWGIENGDWCGIEEIPICCTPPIFTSQGNPFKDKVFYINPYYVAKVDEAIALMSDASLIEKAEKMKNYSNGIWLDSIKSMNDSLERNLKTALAEQNAIGKDVLTVFVVYDLPGRDCHALASYGELKANDDDFERYKSEYIDVIYEHLSKYNNQPVVLIIEPGALPNIIVNEETTPACAVASKYYMDGHAYLIKKLGTLPHVALYLDIGHAFYLGWDDNREKAAKVFSNVIKSGSPGKVRGFASNVASYNPWEDPELSRSPETEWNPCPDEKRYLQAIYKDFKAAGIQSVYFIEDTSRNGGKIPLYYPGDYCNEKGTGIGARPQANPIQGMDYIDAFYWVKPFGESDGTSDKSAASYDGRCSGKHSLKPAPEYGEWFQAFFEEGLKNANPPL